MKIYCTKKKGKEILILKENCLKNFNLFQFSWFNFNTCKAIKYNVVDLT